MPKLRWSVLLLCLLLCGCNEGDNPALAHYTPLVEAHAAAISDGKFDAAKFKAELGWMVRKWGTDNTYQPASDNRIKAYKDALDKLVDAAEKSDNAEAKGMVADICHVMQKRFLTTKMERYREAFPAPAKEQQWWADAQPPAEPFRTPR